MEIASNLYTFTSNGYHYIRATVPKENKRTISKAFPFDINDPLSFKAAEKMAQDWRERIGSLEWGKLRFSLYLNDRITSAQLKMVHRGVRCRKSKARGDSVHTQWIVQWKEFDAHLGLRRAKCKIFSIREFGTLGIAAHEASLFMAKTRARLMASELHLPNFTFDLSEIHAHMQKTHS